MRRMGGRDVGGSIKLGSEQRIAKCPNPRLQSDHVRRIGGGRHESEGYGCSMNGL